MSAMDDAAVPNQRVYCGHVLASGEECGFDGLAYVSSYRYVCPQCGSDQRISRNSGPRRKLALAEQRNAVLEAVLVEVWRWTNDGHPHLELLIPLLLKADSDNAAIVELERLEHGYSMNAPWVSQDLQAAVGA